MLRTQLPFAFTIGFALTALHCSGDDTLPSSQRGDSDSVAGRSGGQGGAAGTITGSAGISAGRGGGSGGGVGISGTAGVAAAAGSPSGGAGAGGASGSAGAAAGTSGNGTAGGGGLGTGGTELVGAGGAAAGIGGLSGAGPSTSGAGGVSGSGTAGSGTGGAAPSAFAPIAEIIGANCATSECHPNSKGQHSNLHDSDGKLLERLLSTTTTVAGAKDACKNLPLVVPGNPDQSLIMHMIVADETKRMDCGNRMPYDCPNAMYETVCLLDPDIEKIRSWIAAGAQP
jgi:hypothetical protein